ncbi:MAG: hypothetical protein J3Q66DRAFT_365802 [Benniella sp.]|nr:MAG: hypothetical protein J3Q66DRAFT_365802 [Benniella sp.]
MDDMDIAELADEETLTRSMRKKHIRVAIPKSELATPRDNFIGHVGHLSKAKSDELSRTQQQRHAQLRENELRVKIDVQLDRKEMPEALEFQRGAVEVEKDKDIYEIEKIPNQDTDKETKETWHLVNGRVMAMNTINECITTN